MAEYGPIIIFFISARFTFKSRRCNDSDLNGLLFCSVGCISPLRSNHVLTYVLNYVLTSSQGRIEVMPTVGDIKTLKVLNLY